MGGADQARQQPADAQLGAGEPVVDAGAAEASPTSPARRMSAPSVRHRPPPYAGPFTAAIDGLRHRAHRRAPGSDMNSIARIAMRDIGSPSQSGGMPWSSRSSPEQKPRPAPVSTTTQVSLSARDGARARRTAARRCRTTSRSCRSGRFSTMQADVRDGLLDGDVAHDAGVYSAYGAADAARSRSPPARRRHRRRPDPRPRRPLLHAGARRTWAPASSRSSARRTVTTRARSGRSSAGRACTSRRSTHGKESIALDLRAERRPRRLRRAARPRRRAGRELPSRRARSTRLRLGRCARSAGHGSSTPRRRASDTPVR